MADQIHHPLITDHVYRNLLAPNDNGNHRATNQCAYMNCRQPASAHAKTTKRRKHIK